MVRVELDIVKNYVDISNRYISGAYESALYGSHNFLKNKEKY